LEDQRNPLVVADPSMRIERQRRSRTDYAWEAE
jgi:hypothetical protein